MLSQPSSLFKRTPNLEKLFAEQDVFFVGGGNTWKSMLLHGESGDR